MQPHVGHVTKGSCGFYGKSAPCLVWCPWVFCKCRYNVFNLSRDLTRPHNWGVIQINGCGLLVVCHHPDKFRDLKWPYVYRIIWMYGWKLLTVSHHTANVWWTLVLRRWRYKMFNLPRDLTKPHDWKIMQFYEWELLTVCHNPAKFFGRRYCGTSDAIFSVCHVI